MAAARTPYDRPSLEPPVPENPSWLVSTTRMIASGAGKLISSVFGSDSSSSSSSSSSASSGGESSAGDFFFFSLFLGRLMFYGYLDFFL